MKSNYRSVKLFLVVAFSCTSLLVSLTPILAKQTANSSPSDRSGSKITHPQAITFNEPSLPPGPPPAGRVRGGAKRGGCDATELDLTALVPFTKADSVTYVWGQTTLEHPSWYFYVPYTKQRSYVVQFVLQDPHSQDSQDIYRKAIALPDKPGIIRVSLPSASDGLALNKQYHWFLTIDCDKDKDAPPLFVEGVIKRVQLNPVAIKELQTKELLKRYAIYAQNGIWYEALTILAQLRQKNPQDATVLAQWQNLLSSIHLDDIAAQPIISEQP